jgi:putative FmdB family regulatory protein
MPVYEYLCDTCGPFIRMRPMSEYDLPFDCPRCRASAPRVLLTAPQCLGMSVQRRHAHAANERSAHAPGVRSALNAPHGAGCGCCATSNSKLRPKSAAKSFPSRRPWMLSH